ncbi:MAG: ribosome maturation factor RimP [Streptosporangiales bacterium]|nr:ribosome maturation factor RimP [Streptosporangiales bacterium]
MPGTELRDRLVAVIGPAVGDDGLELETVTVQPVGRRRVVRVVVDRDGGVTSDELAEASQRVSRALDEADTMGAGAYTLELSTPGTDRPLSEPKHWRRARSRLVRVPLQQADDETVELRGRVVTADDDAVVLEHDGDQHRYLYENLGAGRVEVEFRRPAGDAAGAAEPEAGEDVQ